MNFFKTITVKLTIWYLVILALLLGSFGFGVHFSLSSVLRRNLDSELISRVEHLSRFRDLLSIIASGTFEDAQGEYLSFYYYQDDELKEISNKKSPLLIDSEIVDEGFSGEPFFYNTRIPGEGLFRVYVSEYEPEKKEFDPEKFSQKKPPKRDFRRKDNRKKRRPEYNRPERRRDNDWNKPERPEDNKRWDDKKDPPVYIDSTVLILARPAGWIGTILDYLKNILFVAIPLTLLVSCCGGIFIARRALQPVKEITDTARQIGENDLTKRISINTKDELGTLSETINRMIARLEKAFIRQKEFTGDASHELRAPLAVIQAEATLALQKERDAGAYRKTIEVIAGEADQMNSLTNQLLELARADSGKKEMTFTMIDLTKLVTDICSTVSILCDEKNIRFEQNLDSVPYVKGEISGIRRVILNILSNAIKYTETGGVIHIELKQKGDMIIVSVADSGIGIHDDQLTKVFERFYRVDKSRSRSDKSSGLGLAICKRLVNLHSGSIKVKSTPGKGSTFIISLPV